jgi:hypothetical protein
MSFGRRQTVRRGRAGPVEEAPAAAGNDSRQSWWAGSPESRQLAWGTDRTGPGAGGGVLVLARNVRSS